uniref:Uncharacterized protein n=1 Tax=Anopheles melas TaxID=34690 RepID=A0A182TZM4_9DIPT
MLGHGWTNYFRRQNLQDTLKMSNYPDIQDWMDPHSKLPPVILNDKLMTDAIIGTCMPIKTEHSYSLNSDGDSLPDTIPDSPHSLQNKMDAEPLTRGAEGNE